MTKTINFKVSEIAIRGSPNAYVSNPIVGHGENPVFRITKKYVPLNR